MSGNSFGKIFSITTFGESHGEAIGVIIDGCPSNITIDMEYIQAELDKRKPGQSKITTQRKESDTVSILSGIFEGKTTGTPIAMLIPNEDQRSKDYNHNTGVYRPSHADFTYQEKYGIRDHRGGGRSSARETAARVAAGALAKLFLKQHGIEIAAYVSAVGEMSIPQQNPESITNFIETRESNILRCPLASKADEMIAYIDGVRKDGDTIGGIVSCIVRGCPTGLGEPVFDKLHADLGKAMLSINAVHGFEYGSGFAGASMRGSAHNDIFEPTAQGISTKTNHAGGILGGISTGADIYFRVAFKPVATIMHTQATVDKDGNVAEIKGKGRHDPCVVPRAVPIVEAMAAIVVADHYLRQKIYTPILNDERNRG